MSDVAAASNTTATLASTSAIDDPVVDVGGSSDGASGVLFFKTVGGRVATVVKSSATNITVLEIPACGFLAGYPAEM